MPKSLSKEISSIVEKNIKMFLKGVSEKYEIDKDELMGVWYESQGSNKVGVKRSNGYINFGKEHRQKVKEENPDMAFGDVTKKLASMWKELSDEEKAKWKIYKKEHQLTQLLAVGEVSHAIDEKPIVMSREIDRVRKKDRHCV